MKRIIALVAVVLAGCSSGGGRAGLDNTPAQSVELSAAQRADIEQGVRRGLKDPVSAMFGDTMKAAIKRDDPETYYVCGWVNSKNSFGGYVGDQPFLAMYFHKLKSASLIGVGGPRSDSFIILNQCKNYGVYLSPA